MIIYKLETSSMKKSNFLYTTDQFFDKVEPFQKDGIYGLSFHLLKIVSDVHDIYLDNDSKKNTVIICDYPECSNSILIPFKLKKRLRTTNAVKYSKISNFFCSKECRNAHFKLLSESEFFHLETIKNHKLSMCRNDFDLSKLNEWKNEPIIGRNKTEICAKLLKRKILSIEELTGINYMLSTDVSKFLAKELHGNLKVTYKDTRIYSRRVMFKTVQLFSNEFRIQKNEKGILSIELIKTDV